MKILLINLENKYFGVNSLCTVTCTSIINKYDIVDVAGRTLSGSTDPLASGLLKSQ